MQETGSKLLEGIIYPTNKAGSRKDAHSQRNQIDCMLRKNICSRPEGGRKCLIEKLAICHGVLNSNFLYFSLFLPMIVAQDSHVL